MDTKDEKIKLLESFLKGNADNSQQAELQDWFYSEKALKTLSEHYDRVWNTPHVRDSFPGQQRLFRQIKQTISGKRETRRIFLKAMRFAAAACFFLLAGWAGYFLISSPALSEDHSLQRFSIRADKGQKASLRLPDGTSVWLNSATEISYDRTYGVKERNVYLRGEAYFKVASDKKCPFVVHARDLKIEALGTAFNLKAYDSDKEITATLVEGRLRAVCPSRQCLIDPDEQLVHDPSTGKFEKKRLTDASNVSCWKEGKLVFYGENLEQIAGTLSRMYNVKILFDEPELKQYGFEGMIRNNSLSNILEMISLTAPVEYRIEDEKITIAKKPSLKNN